MSNNNSTGWRAGTSSIAHYDQAQTLGALAIPQAAVAAPTGGATTDAEARTAIDALIARLVAAGILTEAA